MEDLERWEAHYVQGGLNSSHRKQRLLQRLHQGVKGIDIPLDDTGGTQGGRITEERKVLQGEDILDR